MKKLIMATALMFPIIIATAQNNKPDETSIRNVANTLQQGWNEKSGEKFASVFAPVHDYIVVNGVYFPALTQQDNARAHQQLFDGRYKTTSLQLKVDRIHFYREDLAYVTALGASYDEGAALPRDPAIIMTLVMEKKDNDWKIISFHNHEFDIESVKRASPMPLEVMYASWYKK